jgi:ADP-heptose:LPS heptosyltransferase/Flp pilus assembly protein TadD
MIGLTLLRRRASRYMRRQAETARENRDYMKAAVFYEKALRHVSNHGGLHVQCGHMFKEAGAFDRAEQHYKKAQNLMPDDPDLALQFGHFYKVAGRLDEAELAYRRAVELAPTAAEPAHELAELLRSRRDDDSGEGARLFPDFPVRKPLRAKAATSWRANAAAAAAQSANEKIIELIRQAEEACRAGDHRIAALRYAKAEALAPNDPDVVLRLGYFHQTLGKLKEAERAYRRASELAPDWAEPAEQLAELYDRGWRNQHGDNTLRPSGMQDTSRAKAVAPFVNRRGDQDGFSLDQLLFSELAPRPHDWHLKRYPERVTILQLGRRARTPWGMHTTLYGVEAIRGFCISASPVSELRVSLNGLLFYREHAFIGHPLKYESRDRNKRKYIFNIWYDFSQFTHGLYNIDFEFLCESGRIRAYRDVIAIDERQSIENHPNSDRLVAGSSGDDRPLDEQINTQPSMIRPARRTLLPTPLKTVLVVRVDQLGDMVTSIPAVERLRELMPGARLVGLLSGANAELAETLGLFDEIITIQFGEDEWERRRIFPLDRQDELRHRLGAYKFDLAIDLSIGIDSRPFLPLSGARYALGFRDDRAPWLSASLDLRAPDQISGFCELSHSGQVATLVEYLGVLLADRSRTIRRGDLSRERLMAIYGLAAEDAFAVLHTGARLKFSQWPHYDVLASMLLERTGLKVVMLTDDPEKRAKLPRDLAISDRFQLLDGRLPFDDFDALLSYCAVFVGNDSGPSHLASLRGANVVNLYMSRHAWNEWGHENRGYIISRRVPCAGCNIHYDPEECGREFVCITKITPEEVFETVKKLI